MTFKDLKKRISSSTLEIQQQTRLFDICKDKPFWIWDIQEHKLEDFRTKGACDRDVLTNVNSKIKINDFEIKTSSIFKQLNELDLLTDDDKQKLVTFQGNIIKTIPEKCKTSREYHIYGEIKNDANASMETKNKIASLISEHEIEIYDESKRSEINNFVCQLMAKHNIRIKILNPDFEGVFNHENFNRLLHECKSFCGTNKVLQGVYLASNTHKESIRDAIKDVINTLKSF